MKRDMDCVRAILMKIEEVCDGVATIPDANWIEGFSREAIMYHLSIMDEAGLVKGVEKGFGDGSEYFPIRLTWQGHEFLDAAKNHSIWSKAVMKVKSNVGTVSFAVFQAVLLDYTKRNLGLQ